MKKYFIFILALCFLACNNKGQDDFECITLSVDLEQPTLQFNDVFDSVELILLETSDSSLVVYPYEIIEHEGYYYIYDLHLEKTIVFDKKGKFVRQIGKKGQGPGEYTHLSSISIDKKNNVIHLVEPIGGFNDYTLDGKFLGRRQYPDAEDYQCIYHLDDCMAMWSFPSSNESDCLFIVNQETMEIVKTYYNMPVLTASRGFYYYQDKLYFHELIGSSRVYEVTKDSLALSYQWNFGNDNVNVYDLDLTFKDENRQVEYDLFWKYMKDGTVPYIKVGQAQNKDYYYACLRYQYKYDRGVFYRKRDGACFILGEESWNMPTNALVFTDDYMIILMNHNNYSHLIPFLSEADRNKIIALKEDDNPCLLKFYFRK